jgi:hypothetical protein
LKSNTKASFFIDSNAIFFRICCFFEDSSGKARKRRAKAKASARRERSEEEQEQEQE